MAASRVGVHVGTSVCQPVSPSPSHPTSPSRSHEPSPSYTSFSSPNTKWVAATRVGVRVAHRGTSVVRWCVASSVGGMAAAPLPVLTVLTVHRSRRGGTPSIGARTCTTRGVTTEYLGEGSPVSTASPRWRVSPRARKEVHTRGCGVVEQVKRETKRSIGRRRTQDRTGGIKKRGDSYDELLLGRVGVGGSSRFRVTLGLIASLIASYLVGRSSLFFPTTFSIFPRRAGRAHQPVAQKTNRQPRPRRCPKQAFVWHRTCTRTCTRARTRTRSARRSRSCRSRPPLRHGWFRGRTYRADARVAAGGPVRVPVPLGTRTCRTCRRCAYARGQT